MFIWKNVNTNTSAFIMLFLNHVLKDSLLKELLWFICFDKQFWFLCFENMILLSTALGTHHCIMSGDHGKSILTSQFSTHQPCCWPQITMIELCHYTHWSYWRLVSFIYEYKYRLKSQLNLYLLNYIANQRISSYKLIKLTNSCSIWRIDGHSHLTTLFKNCSICCSVLPYFFLSYLISLSISNTFPIIADHAVWAMQ